MKKHSLHKPIFAMLLLITCQTLCSGQTKTGLEQMFVRSLRDQSGNLWLCTVGNGVYRYDAFTGHRTILTEREGLCANKVHSIFEDKVGNLWFTTAKGICRYDGKSFTPITIKEGLWNNAVSCILEDKNGNFWFGTNGWGIYRYDPSANKTDGKSVIQFTTKEGLGSDAVQCMLQDKSGNIWVGERAGGVCQYNSATGRFTKAKGTCFSSQIMSIPRSRKTSAGCLVGNK